MQDKERLILVYFLLSRNENETWSKSLYYGKVAKEFRQGGR